MVAVRSVHERRRGGAVVIVQALIAALTRSAGKLLNTAFGWATILLFGRVSQDRQIYVSAVAFGSVIWLVGLTGVAFPAVATFLLSFVTLPKWIEKTWIRLAMLAAVIVIPALIGAVSILMLDKEKRPHGTAGVAKAVLKGYPYTVGLALTLAMMIVFAPILKVRALVRRWTTEHVPVIVRPSDYDAVVDAIHAALADGGLATDRGKAGWMLRAPTRVLTLFARSAVAGLVANRITALRSSELEVVLHPADLVISGREASAAHARAIVAEHVVFTPAYLTWDKEANEVEDRLGAIWNARDARPSAELRAELKDVEARLHELEVPYEEWEVLFRELLLLERALREGGRSVSAGPGWAATLGAGMAVAAPHAETVAESIEETVKELRHTADRAPRSVPALSVVAAALGAIAALAARPWRRARSNREVGKSADASRRRAA
jgi:hypothetical protein